MTEYAPREHVKKWADAVRASCPDGDKIAKGLLALDTIAHDRLETFSSLLKGEGRYEIPPASESGRITVTVYGTVTVKDWRRVSAFAALASGEIDDDEIEAIRALDPEAQ